MWPLPERLGSGWSQALPHRKKQVMKMREPWRVADDAGVTGVRGSRGREGVWVMAPADQRPVNQVDRPGDQRVSRDGQEGDTSVGVRPVYAITEQFKLVTELGRDQVEAPGGTRKLTKFTIAPTWSPAGPGFWERPEIRLYYTYASWNEAAQRSASLLAAGS
eukprot:gene4601-5748_t